MTGPGYKSLPQEVKDELPEEVRAALHAILNDLATVVTGTEMSQIRHEMLAKRMDVLEELILEHNVYCKDSKKEMQETLQIVRHIKSGMTITNFLRNAFLWVGGIATTAYGLWNIGKDLIK